MKKLLFVFLGMSLSSLFAAVTRPVPTDAAYLRKHTAGHSFLKCPTKNFRWMTCLAGCGEVAGANDYAVLATSDNGVGFRDMLIARSETKGGRIAETKIVIGQDGLLRWTWKDVADDGTSKAYVFTCPGNGEPAWPFDVREVGGQDEETAWCPDRTTVPSKEERERLLKKVEMATAKIRYDAGHAAIARRVCAEGSVLLKNDGVLPLPRGTKLAVFGPVDGEWLSCGGMSARTNPHYTCDLSTGLKEAGFDIDPKSREVAILVLTRTCGRGGEPDLAAYDLTEKEKAQLADLKEKGFHHVVVVINNGVAISTAELAAESSVSAILMVGFPGMEGGRAIADILVGAVNPSGRLPQTLAKKVTDYPADENWQESLSYVPYEDDIFVGYRYFETIPGAAAKVEFPFGFGLSYTTFALSDMACEADGDGRKVTVRVTNKGRVAGRNSVLVYTSVMGGRAEHAAKELRGFAKTRLLAPNESEMLTVRFRNRDLAYFDDENVSGKNGSWVIDGGTYTVWLGGSVRDVTKVGSFELSESILATPGFKLNPARLARRLRANGGYDRVPVAYGEKSGAPVAPRYPVKVPERPIVFDDLLAGRKSVDDFLDQLSAEETLELLHGQPNLYDWCDTCSIGRLDKYGLPGLQTADGPLGVRLEGANTTQFPGTDVLAGTFDVELARECGKVIGEEAKANGIDIMLAPGININRHPICARNFEFMGEDPLLAGCISAAVIEGIQGKGVAATIKHFFANNRINTCGEYMSVISERAAREIYLKGFEIAIGKSSPACVMTAYNGVNGRFAGGNQGALDGILRGEWGFSGIVMTDWGAQSLSWNEIMSGNDVKMPRDPGAERTLWSLKNGNIPQWKVRASAKRVIELLLAYKNRKPTWESRLPRPVFDEKPELVEFYRTAWEISHTRIDNIPGIPVPRYMDEGHRSDWIWIWDTCFMAHFCKYAPWEFPGIDSLGNFYGILMPDGDFTLPKVRGNRWSCGPKGISEPWEGRMLDFKVHIPENPPLFAWTEYRHALQTGDRARLEKVYREKRYLQRWFEIYESFDPAAKPMHGTTIPVRSKKIGDLGYRWSGGASGMDNTPRGRQGEKDMRPGGMVDCPSNPDLLWVDAYAQQALAALYISRIAELLDDQDGVMRWKAVYEAKKAKINELYWDDQDGFYYDILSSNLTKCKVPTIASYWTLLAEIPDARQRRRLIEKLTDDQWFGGTVPTPSLARKDADFCPQGGYWRGGVWMPTTYMTVKALDVCGESALAREIARKVVFDMCETWKAVEPHTIWECYSPTEPKPSSYKEKGCVRDNFCGWSALGPISLFIENVIGIKEANAFANTLVCDFGRDLVGRVGVEDYRFGQVVCSVLATKDEVSVRSNREFTLIFDGKGHAVVCGENDFKRD